MTKWTEDQYRELEDQELATECVQKDMRIEELESELETKNALIDRAIKVLSMFRDKPHLRAVEQDMRKEREVK